MAEGKKRGRKPIAINWLEVDRFLEAGASGPETASYLGIHYDTLQKRFKKEHSHKAKFTYFSEYITYKRRAGDLKLRVKQFDLAMKGDRGMLIWLGKNRLNQSDRISNEQHIKSIPKINIFAASKKKNAGK